MTTCTADDCDRAAHSRGLCMRHYQHWRRTERVPVERALALRLDGVDYTEDDVRMLLSMAQRCDGLQLKAAALEQEIARLVREVTRLRAQRGSGEGRP